jgi:hypothetical protein
MLLFFIILIMASGCERQFDLSWPQADLKIYKVEDGVKTEITSAKVGEQIIFAKPEESVTDFYRIFKFSLWTGDEGHEYAKIYEPNQLGVVFPGLELPYVYSKAGTYDVVYVISYYNINKEELERKTVTKTITISE